jgi:hypothetical protein
MQQPKPGERGPYLSPFCGHVASAELASRKKLLGGQNAKVGHLAPAEGPYA